MQQIETPSATPVSAADGALFGLLLLVDSMHLVFARALLPYFAPVVSASFVMLVATIQIGGIGLARGELHWATLRQHIRFLAAIGLLVGSATALSYTAVRYIDPGTASMLSKTSTLFALGFGLWWLNERLRNIQIMGGLLAMSGVFTLTFHPDDLLQLGSVIVLCATVMYALHTALVKRYGQTMNFMDFFFGRLLFTTLTLLIIAVSRPVPIQAPLQGWLLVLVAGTVDVALSRALYYLALRRLTMSFHAILLTLSPVATVLWTLLLFDFFPAPQQLIGGFMVIIGVALAAYFRTP